MTENMLKFLIAYYDFAKSNGTRNPYGFNTRLGLCGHSGIWARHNHNDADEHKLQVELEDLFTADGLDLNYPFGEHAYDVGYAQKTQHTDRNRIKWIESKLADVLLPRALCSYLDGCEGKRGVVPCTGICTDIHYWSSSMGYSGYVRRVVSASLESAFAKSGLDTEYPFGEYAYHRDGKERSFHTDANRLNWIKEYLAHVQK